MKDTVRAQVFARCKGYCEKCGKPMSISQFAVHHRQLGNRKNNTAVNLMAVHHECHNQHRTSIHDNPRSSRDRGWIVSKHADPWATPILLPGEKWAYLNEDFTYRMWVTCLECDKQHPTLSAAAMCARIDKEKTA